MKYLSFGLVFASIVAIAQPAAWAADDHDRARRAYQAGQVVGLAQILAFVSRSYRGQVLEIELDKRKWTDRGDMWIYEVTMLTPQGHVVILELDAKSNQQCRSRRRRGTARDDRR